jgi:hypothetical protein
MRMSSSMTDINRSKTDNQEKRALIRKLDLRLLPFLSYVF